MKIFVTAQLDQAVLDYLQSRGEVILGGWGTTGKVLDEQELVEQAAGCEMMIICYEKMTEYVFRNLPDRHFVSCTREGWRILMRRSSSNFRGSRCATLRAEMQMRWRTLIRIIDKIFSKFCEFSAVLFGCIMIVVAFYQVIMRFVFSDPPSWSEAVCRYSMVWFVFTAAGWGVKKYSHVRVDILITMSSPLSSSTAQMSVLVPPTSTPMRIAFRSFMPLPSLSFIKYTKYHLKKMIY